MEMHTREKRHFRGTKNKLTKCLKRSIEYTDGYSGKRKAKRKSSNIPYVVLRCTTERQTWRFLATLWKQQLTIIPMVKTKEF